MLLVAQAPSSLLKNLKNTVRLSRRPSRGLMLGNAQELVEVRNCNLWQILCYDNIMMFM